MFPNLSLIKTNIYSENKIIIYYSVFYSNNPDEPWTGDIENGLFFGQNEVYNWIIKLRIDNSAEEISFTGSVLMIR